jgi:hypothetical protein
VEREREERTQEDWRSKEEKNTRIRKEDTANHPLSNPILFTIEMRLHITGYVPNRLVSSCISETSDNGQDSGKCLGKRYVVPCVSGKK